MALTDWIAWAEWIYVDCIRCALHWIDSSIFLLNCIGLRSRMKSGQMGIHWIAIKLDWIRLETRRGSGGEILSRAEIRISQMPSTPGSVQKLGL